MKKEYDFETAIKELEQITARLESGELSLEESIGLFEKGIRLSDICRTTLENARQKMVSITEAEGEKDGDA